MKDKTVLITGGTGSLGHALTKRFLKDGVKKLIILSRDEFKQGEMERKFREPNIRFFLGDVRDDKRLHRAFDGVDIVVHAAALKQVPKLEYNPSEAIKTNIIGTQNVIDACCIMGVEKAVFISTDKAVQPINLYGGTKMVAEKLWLASNAYDKTKFTAVRYGNVIGSRGSVVPLFQELKAQGIKEFPITDKNMTRFWITLDEAVDLVVMAISCEGVEPVVPMAPAMNICDIARAIDPECKLEEIGIRPGEKVHEMLVLAGEHVYSEWTFPQDWAVICSNGYTSDQPSRWMTEEEFLEKCQSSKE